MGSKIKLPKINKKNFPYKLVICYWEDIVSDASWIDIVDIKKAKTAICCSVAVSYTHLTLPTIYSV